MAGTIGTTNLDALPLAPQNQENIQLNTYERGQQQQGMQQQPPQSMQQQTQQGMQQQPQQGMQQPQQPQQPQRPDDPAVMQRQLNQFVTGLQQASAAGMTALPSRDIPQSQEHLIRDPQMQPNYLPAPIPQQTDYIRQQDITEDMIKAQMLQNMRAQQPIKTTADYLYEQLQIPIVIGILYFLFQLPFVRNLLFKFLPNTFNADGSQNLSGYISSSVIFGGLYLLATKAIVYIAV